MSPTKQAIKYIAFDLIGSALAWTLFFIYRKAVIEPELLGHPVPLVLTDRYVLGVVLIPLFWVVLLAINGFYRDVFRRSRLRELGLSLWITLAGVLVIFFILLLDDYIATYKHYYQLIATLFLLQLLCTYPFRLLITSSTISKIHSRRFGFPTLIVGDDERALELYNDLQGQAKSQGNMLIGYVSTGLRPEHSLAGLIPHLGPMDQVEPIVQRHRVEEVIIALESSDHPHLTRLINELMGTHVILKAIPSLYDHLTGRVKMTSILGAPLIQLTFELMPSWQRNVKTLMDFALSTLALVLLSPLMLALAVIVKATSRGPVLHTQERIGRYGKPFILYKFRTMWVDAERNGPALSSRSDSRITPFGRFLRKTRLDELPNFYNVFRGEMSLVGPRPERQFFIDQIVKRAPHYVHLQKVKPGITSWGQVKYGYAETVDGMVERLKYDLLYLENMSIYVDLKIIIYTLITVFRGRGI